MRFYCITPHGPSVGMRRITNHMIRFVYVGRICTCIISTKVVGYINNGNYLKLEVPEDAGILVASMWGDRKDKKSKEEIRKKLLEKVLQGPRSWRKLVWKTYLERKEQQNRVNGFGFSHIYAKNAKGDMFKGYYSEIIDFLKLVGQNGHF